MSTDDPATALVVALKAAIAPIKVYDSIVIGTADNPVPLQHVVVYPDAGLRSYETVWLASNTGDFGVQVTCVAAGVGRALGDECRYLQRAVQEALIGRILFATGWVCGPIEHDFTNKPQRDEDVQDKPTVYSTDGYKFLADRLILTP